MPRVSGAQKNGRAHGMGERKDRRGTIRKDNLMDESFQINLVLREVAHVTLAPIPQRPLGSSLAAPIERGHGKTAGAQVAHGFEIFLDELGASLEQTHRALAARRR